MPVGTVARAAVTVPTTGAPVGRTRRDALTVLADTTAALRALLARFAVALTLLSIGGPNTKRREQPTCEAAAQYLEGLAA